MDADRAVLTRHGHHRRTERGVPHSVLSELCTAAASFLGHGGVRFRIVRRGEAFWIAPLREGYVLTVYAEERTGMDAWAQRHLVNPDQTRHRLQNLPDHVTPEEAITQELAGRWLEV